MGERCLRFVLILAVPVIVGAVGASPGLEVEPSASLPVELTFDPDLRAEPFSGRVYLLLTDETSEEALEKRLGKPPRRRSWLSREQVFSFDAAGWRPGEPLQPKLLRGYPSEAADLPKQPYHVRAVMHVNPQVPHRPGAAGNLYSPWVKWERTAEPNGLIRLRLGRRIAKPNRQRTIDRAVAVELRSDLLSEFHGRDVFMRAMVLPPECYRDDEERQYPAVYVIPGFGGNHHQGILMATMLLGKTDTPFVLIGLDPTCPLGHHTFADSDNNGPVGRALTEELIPHLEKRFRLIPAARGRLLTGHSSGGWSSLWLQITYPDVFGGVWASAPDSVGFADFCGINLYDPKTNFYFDSEGRSRPVMRRDGKVLLTMRDFARMEGVIGPGGQLHSFEAVFGLRDKDGRPRRLYDRKTGAIERGVVESWRRYDMIEILEKRWALLGPKLTGKITVIVGSEDNFYLAGAVQLLKKTLHRLGSDARIFIEDGKDHGSILRTEPFQRIAKEMSERFLASRERASSK